MMDWLAAHYAGLRSLWAVWFLILFVGIIAWAFWPRNKERLERQGRIPLDDDR